jgi:Tol biopolymer transport system component
MIILSFILTFFFGFLPGLSIAGFLGSVDGDLDTKKLELDRLEIVETIYTEIGAFSPSFSGDSKRVVYTKVLYFSKKEPIDSLWSNRKTEIEAVNEIRLLEINGLKRRSLAYHGRNPIFSPNDTYILFEGGVAGQDSGIWRMNADGSDKRLLVADASLPDGFLSAPYWHPNGDRVVCAIRDLTSREDKGIYILDKSGCNVQLLQEEGDYPVFSPHGTWLAFWVNRPKAKSGLWIVNKGFVKKRLSSSQFSRDLQDPSLSWFPCERKVLFVDKGVYLVDPTTGERIVLSETGSSACFDSKMSYVLYMDERGLWIVDKGGKYRKLLKNIEGKKEPSYIQWSPNGRRVVYSFVDSGKPLMSLCTLGIFVGKVYEVSLGRESGLRRGQRLRVFPAKTDPFTGEEVGFDQGRSKGTLTVTDVFDGRSICILKEPKREEVKEGDVVWRGKRKGFVVRYLGDKYR